MRVALTELRRRPGRFVPVLATLTLLTVLLLLLGGLLDGLYLGSSGALRAQPGELIVYDAGARGQLERSTIDGEVRAIVEQVEGVTEVGGIGSVAATIDAEDGDDPISVVVFGYETLLAGFPAPAPGPGHAVADTQLRHDGLAIGDQVVLGGDGPVLEIVGFVDDIGYALRPALWVDPDTWREARAALRPDTASDNDAFDALVVHVDGDPEVVARRIDDATGATETLTIEQAVLAIPGLEQQNTVFGGLIGATFAVAGLVVALFAALIVVERTALYGVLKALGTPSRRLLAGLLAQAVTIAVLAYLAGGLVTLGLAQALPDSIPLRLEPDRAATTVVLLVFTAAVGSVLTLRRVVRIEPASAIGGS